MPVIPRYMPPMCQMLGPDLGDELQQAAEARLRELGTTNPTPTDIARAIAHEEHLPMTNKAPIYLRRFQAGVDAIREELQSITITAPQACLEWGLAPAPDDCIEVEPHELRLRPSIHMPRSMSRITLEITGVRVERLQDISEADARCEGCPWPPEWAGRYADRDETARGWFRGEWNAIHGPGSWDANPWVWVLEFRRLR